MIGDREVGVGGVLLQQLCQGVEAIDPPLVLGHGITTLGMSLGGQREQMAGGIFADSQLQAKLIRSLLILYMVKLVHSAGTHPTFQ